jgi:hypothetical protein
MQFATNHLGHFALTLGLSGTRRGRRRARRVGELARPPVSVQDTAAGAATSVLLATSPRLAGIGGRYFEDCNEAEVVSGGESLPRGVAPYALDPESATRLWEASVQMLGQ